MNRLLTPKFEEAITDYPLYSQDGKARDAVCVAIFTIGNILSRGKNSGLQNYDFDTKKTTIRNSNGEIVHYGYDTGSYSEIEVSRKDEWTPASIIERGKQLLHFLKTHWQIDYTFTDDDYNKLLNLS